MNRHSYLKNAAILTATGLFLRAAGMLFRIYLAAKIGAEGMGLYQLIFTVYTLAVTIATGGISILSTRVAADMLTTRPSALRAAMRKVLILSVALGLLAAIILFIGADASSVYWLHDERASLALKVLAPSLPVMAMSASLRGYFMACRKVAPNAKAQIMEQFIRLGLVALIINNAIPNGIGAACAAVVFGNTISEIASWLYMAASYLKDIKGCSAKEQVPHLGLLHILTPVAAGGYLSSTLRTIENVLVPTSLALFTHSRDIALAQYGALKGMAMPVMFFPFSFMSTLSTLLLPEITRAHLKKESKTLEYLISRVMLITCIFSFIAAGLFTMFSREIGLTLYKSEEIGWYICILGPLTPIMYLESMVDGILKGLDEQLASFRYSVADSLIRIILIALILPRFGMQGFLFIMVLSNLFTGLLNLNRLFKTTKIKFNTIAWVLKPCTALALCAIFKQFVLVPLIGTVLPPLAFTIAAAALTGTFYMIVLWLIGGYKRADFLPKSHKA